MHPRVFIVILLILGFSSIDSIASRGGGSRGGGGSRSGGSYRGGGSRSSGSRSNSGIRSGSIGRLGTSVRYTIWTRKHGYAPNFNYRYSSYSERQRGFMTGLIIMSTYQRTRFSIHHESAYNDISICYNERPLYGRNITKSPWFMCPWNDLSERYCCGDEIEQRCCRYFDRSGHLSGLIIGIIVICFLFGVVCFYCCRRTPKEDISVEFTEDKFENEGHACCAQPAIVQTTEFFSPYPAPSVPYDAAQPYPPPTLPYDASPPYPVPSDTSPPYPMPSEEKTGYPPYPAMNPSAPVLQSTYPPQQWNPSGYDETGPRYPLIPPEAPPPSYSDLGKHQ